VGYADTGPAFVLGPGHLVSTVPEERLGSAFAAANKRTSIVPSLYSEFLEAEKIET